MNIRKLYCLLLGIMFMVSFAACEEEDSPLLFTQEEISDPDNVKLEYYSPDPCCVSKEYHISANSNASELTIRCTNANSIFITNRDGGHLQEFTSADGKWKATLVDENVITFAFDEIWDDKAEFPVIYQSLKIVSQTKKGEVSTYIQVRRHLHFADTVPSF